MKNRSFACVSSSCAHLILRKHGSPPYVALGTQACLCVTVACEGLGGKGRSKEWRFGQIFFMLDRSSEMLQFFGDRCREMTLKLWLRESSDWRMRWGLGRYDERRKRGRRIQQLRQFRLVARLRTLPHGLSRIHHSFAHACS